VASKGGFVGIYFMPFLNPSGHATADDVVAHIDHAVNVCGEDHVGIGTGRHRDRDRRSGGLQGHAGQGGCRAPSGRSQRGR